jgi:hypothetical protein
MIMCLKGSFPDFLLSFYSKNSAKNKIETKMLVNIAILVIFHIILIFKISFSCIEIAVLN